MILKLNKILIRNKFLNVQKHSKNTLKVSMQKTKRNSYSLTKTALSISAGPLKKCLKNKRQDLSKSPSPSHSTVQSPTPESASSLRIQNLISDNKSKILIFPAMNISSSKYRNRTRELKSQRDILCVFNVTKDLDIRA